ncbi:acetate--CoA ligase [Microaerobacter geothermalis]|uniref:acetate--CoA ligase n=1 Tax=Microaerobacter geothermalis TaxID=674972 RepID=UPI001F21719D|nr:acetate--CoA ligase [Microaerobacter geothermalis]MCF6094910.1 acetate--CoA ligase [Microaerobacter geothermalis]
MELQRENLNLAYLTIDRHCHTWRKNKVALYYVNDRQKESYTFQDVKFLSDQFAGMLSRLGVKKGDRVFFFLPKIPELYFGIIGGLKAGAIVGTLFEGFMQSTLMHRLQDSGATVLVTHSQFLNRLSISQLSFIKHIILVDQAEVRGKYLSLSNEMEKSEPLSAVFVRQEDGALLHYTSGSRGKAKGVLLTHKGATQWEETGKTVLDLRDDDVYWCTANPGWITGMVYGIFSPWLNGATMIVDARRFDPRNWYKNIEEYQVSVWYSSPSAFRMLMSAGFQLIQNYRQNSLRHILSVGENLPPDVIEWGKEAFGITIRDTWLMTETGAILIANLPNNQIKPGSMGKPLPGLNIQIIDDHGNELPPYQVGNLAVKPEWPAMMKEIWNQPQLYEDYFRVNGWFISGDSAYKDEEGYIWYQGRIDDIIITSGERVGPFEIESKLEEHPAVHEAGVIGKPDPIRGEIIKAFVVLKEGIHPGDHLSEEIQQYIKEQLSSYAVPQEIEFIDQLPKTRSGKIIRRVLKSREQEKILNKECR